MSAGHDTHGEGSHHSPWFYVGIAVFLGILTMIELGPLFNFYNLPPMVLLGLSAVKFFTVVAFFMHLWDDASILTRVFAAPLLGATLMVMVLMVLFHTWNPSPRKDNFAVQERYGDNFSGECSSWVRSSISNRLYCTSPAIDRARIDMYEAAKPKPKAPSIDLTGKSEEEVRTLLAEKGKDLFNQNCKACHQENGEGIPGAFPPLAGSDYAGFLDAKQHVGIILHGLNGQITVKGQPYNGQMVSFAALSDFEIAAIATYERNSWGNEHGVVTPDDVKAAR